MQQVRVWRQVPRAALALGALALGVPASSFTSSWTGRRAGAEPGRQGAAFQLASPDFPEDGSLPPHSALARFGCRGRNVAPALHWAGVPPGTVSLALVMTDHDAPIAGGFHHWIAYNIPARATALHDSPSTQGTNSYGFLGFGGPCPPADGQIHHYVFTLYAVMAPGPLEEGLTRDELLAQIGPEVIGAAVTIGTFARR